MPYHFSIFILLNVLNINVGGQYKNQTSLDSINYVHALKIAENFDNRNYQTELKRLTEIIADRTLQNDLFFKLSLKAFKHNDSASFHYWNQKSLENSIIIEDTLKIAEAYWDRANFYYHRNKFLSYLNYDKASKMYAEVGNEFYAARMLLNMGIVQSNLGDFTGSEAIVIEALNIFKKVESKKHIYNAYNNLGILNNELKNYNQALHYHSRAMEILEQLKKVDNLKASSLNNIGIVYKNLGEYSKAIKYYRKGLALNKKSKIPPRTYAMLLDNLAYARFRSGDSAEVLPLLESALEIRKKTNITSGIPINKIHLAEFYAANGDSKSAINYLLEAKELATKTKVSPNLKRALLLLSQIDTTNSRKYLLQYISLNDSLLNEERISRNKLARIRFETDEFLEEKELLEQEQAFLVGGLVVVLIFGGLFFLIKEQRTKNKELEFQREQQKSNEAIYQILLSQTTRIDERIKQERKRISEELHDGVLSSLFGIRLNLSNLNDVADKEAVIKRKTLLESLNGVECEIRALSHNMNNEYLFKSGNYHRVLEELFSQENCNSFELFNEIDQSIEWDDISGINKVNIYRIFQEALMNIKKHSQATEAIISVSLDKNILQISIQDNGKGFTSVNKKGIGIKNITSRVKSMKGVLNINSELGEGTDLLISIPLVKL